MESTPETREGLTPPREPTEAREGSEPPAHTARPRPTARPVRPARVQAPGHRRVVRRSRRRSFQIGRALSTSFSIWGREFIPFNLLALVVFSPLIAFTAWATLTPNDFVWTLAYRAIDFAAPNLLGYVVTATVVYGVFQELRGRRTTIGDCFSNGLARLIPVIVVGVLVAICTALAGLPMLLAVALADNAPVIALPLMLGSFVAIIYVSCALWVAIPACVVEQPGVLASLSRSWELTRGNRGSIFLLSLLFGVAGAVIGVGIGFVAAVAFPSATGLVALLAVVMVSSLEAVLVAVVYHDIRVATEGIDTEELASIFD